MTLPAAVIAIVRTGVQALVAWALSAAWVIALLDWLTTNVGINWSQAAIENWAFGVALLAVTGAVNWAGKHWNWINKLFSLFTSDSPAVYEKTPLAGGDNQPDVQVDTGGEDMGLEKGAITLGVLLAVVALIFAVVALVAGGPWLTVAVICLAVSHLVGGVNLG